MKVTNLMLIAAVLSGLESAADTLTWTGAGGMSWDATTQSWKDAGGSACAWANENDALFNGNGAGAITVAAGLRAQTLTFDGESANYQFDGGELRISGKVVTITNGATFTLNAKINQTTEGNMVTFNVSKSSTLKLIKNGTGRAYPVFNIDGGTLDVNHQGVWIQNLNLSNGALVTDPTNGDGNSQAFRMGCDVPRFWIRSNGPAGATNEIRANVTVWDRNLTDREGTDYRLMIDVGDQPLLMKGRFFGPIAESENSNNARRIDKIGPGTLIMKCNSLKPKTKGETTGAEFGTTNPALRPSVLTAAVHVVEGTMRCEAEYVFRNWEQEVFVGGGTNGVATLNILEKQDCRLTILSNGVARLGATKALRTAPVTIDGGCLYCDNQNNFLCDVTFRNGGVFENASALRIGSGGDSCKFATVRSEGSGTNEIRGMLRFYRYERDSDKESQAIVFDVDAPLRLGQYPHASLALDVDSDTRHTWKTGTGELILDYSVTDDAYSKGVITVKGGSLRLAKDNAMKSDMDLDLAFEDGTALAVSAGKKNSVRKATFAGGVSLDVGEGAELSFAAYDLSALTTLNVPFALGATALRFGTTKCLTDAELAKFRCRGYLFEQDENGYIHSHKRGIVLIFR